MLWVARNGKTRDDSNKTRQRKSNPISVFIETKKQERKWNKKKIFPARGKRYVHDEISNRNVDGQILQSHFTHLAI